MGTIISTRGGELSQKQGRKPKSEIVSADSPTDNATGLPTLPTEPADREISTEVLSCVPLAGQILPESDSKTDQISDMSLFEDVLPPATRDIPRPDEDLTLEQKAEFIKLVRSNMSLPERAQQLAKLARFTDTKRAPVALRAIQTMNELDGFTEEGSIEAPPLFQLPEGAKVAVAIKVPKE